MPSSDSHMSATARSLPELGVASERRGMGQRSWAGRVSGVTKTVRENWLESHPLETGELRAMEDRAAERLGRSGATLRDERG